MIYKDAYANGDKENCPARRSNELCVNCGNGWYGHRGWGCHDTWGKSGPSLKFFYVSPNARYLTPSMQTSIANVGPTVPDLNVDLDLCPATLKSCNDTPVEKVVSNSNNPDWKQWRDINRKSDECACGIRRSNCSFHR